MPRLRVLGLQAIRKTSCGLAPSFSVCAYLFPLNLSSDETTVCEATRALRIAGNALFYC